MDFKIMIVLTLALICCIFSFFIGYGKCFDRAIELDDEIISKLYKELKNALRGD